MVWMTFKICFTSHRLLHAQHTHTYRHSIADFWLRVIHYGGCNKSCIFAPAPPHTRTYAHNTHTHKHAQCLVMRSIPIVIPLMIQSAMCFCACMFSGGSRGGPNRPRAPLPPFFSGDLFIIIYFIFLFYFIFFFFPRAFFFFFFCLSPRRSVW